MDDALNTFLAWLQERHDAILGCEQRAKDVLASGDTAGYTAHLKEKAEGLASLALDAKEVISPLPDELKHALHRKMMRFSQSAAYGLNLQSPFYWSALLYRDDHGPDEPDNLQVFIDEVRAAGSAYRGD